MQRPHGRLTKQEMREDQFVEKILDVWAYCQNNWPKVIAGAGAVVVIVLIGVFISKQAEESRLAAASALGRARIALIEGRSEDALRGAERVIREYSGKPAAGQALQLLGSLHFDQGRHVDARATYEQYLDEHGSEGASGYAAWSGIAACLEEQGDRTGAAERYRSYADAHTTSPFAPISLKEAARCYRGVDDLQTASELYGRIVSEYPKSQAASSAQLELDMMGAP